MKDNLKIFAIIVSYNGRKWIEKCLKSLMDSSIKVEIIVIDNASTDGTSDIIKIKFPFVDLIETGENLGFGKANNIGIRKAINKGADYFFLINQDAWILKETINYLIEDQIKNPHFWIISPLQYNSFQNGIEKQFEIYVKNIDIENENVQEVEFINAAIWLISKNCIELVGVFNPLFRQYGEDNDYVSRVQFWGGRVGVSTRSIAYHEREPLNLTRIGIKPNQRKIETISLGLLLNINHSLLYNYFFVIILFIKNEIKYLLLFNFKVFLSYFKAQNILFSISPIIKSRKKSKTNSAYL
jgi:GT2 family glycosyltransferase